MGSFHSVQSKKHERRRSNRLSKPPTNKAIIDSTNSSSPRQAAAVVTDPLAWQNPWTGTTIPISQDYNTQRSRSFPSVSPHPEAPRSLAKKVNTSQIVIEETDESSPQPPSPNLGSSVSLSRRTSIRPSGQTPLRTATLYNYHHLSQVDSGQPMRSYSLHSLPNKAKGTIRDQTFEEAAASNTHFMVDNQRFSLIRRRSLLTRPGVATRRSTKRTARRVAPLIGQECKQSFVRTAPVHPQSLPLSRVEDAVWTPSLAQLRPPTPSESEYTHLGNLKLGSLRVVNGSASPCPSDRTRIDQTSTPGVGSDDSAAQARSCHLQGIDRNDTVGDHTSDAEDVILHSVSGVMEDSLQDVSARYLTKPSTPLLQIPPLYDSKKYDDLPASPFSFERSPTSVSHCSRKPYLFSKEDEGVSDLDEEVFDRQPMRIATDNSFTGRSVRLKNTDSGYSSATSIRSLQDGRSRVSIDSQASTPYSPEHRGSTLGSSFGDCEIYCSQLPMHSNLSIHGPKMSFVAEQNGWPLSTSTPYEPQQIFYNGRIRSSSYSVPQTPNRTIYQTRYCTQLRELHSTTDYIPSSTYLKERPQSQELRDFLYSDHYIRDANDLKTRSAQKDYVRGEFKGGAEVTMKNGQQTNRLLRSASVMNIAQQSSGAKSARAMRPNRKKTG